jgi:hypothetical protein
MGNMFSAPKPQQQPKAPEPTPLPIRDDEAMRREKMKTYAAASQRGGSESTRMSGGDLGSVANTRTGAAPSRVLGAG